MSTLTSENGVKSFHAARRGWIIPASKRLGRVFLERFQGLLVAGRYDLQGGLLATLKQATMGMTCADGVY